MTKVGFIGLGQMGKHMALNMLRAPGQFIVGARKPDLFAEFEKRGAATTTNFADIAAADIIFLCLSNGEAVESVLFGEAGIANLLRVGTIVVDTSTITYGATLRIVQDLERRHVHFLDAPISGMEARAADGTLTVMCGGDRQAFEAVSPYFDSIGNKILYMGASGSGQLAKLINQLLFDINAAALAEILPMAVKVGLDPVSVEAIVNSGTGRSYASEFFLPRILDGKFNAGYPIKAAYKDLVSAAELSAQLGIPLPVLGSATATYQQALLKGYGDHDKGGMIRLFEDLLGVQFRRASTQI